MSLAEDRPAGTALPAKEPSVDPMADHLLAIVDGYEPAAQKRLVMAALRLGMIDGVTADILIDALGLKGA